VGYELYSQVVHPRLPFEEGERIVVLELLDNRDVFGEPRLSRDFAVWRDALGSIEDLGAAATASADLVTGAGRGEPIAAAAMTASAFRVTRVPPLMGRTLVDADESPGAPLVAVLGYEVWQRRFGPDPDVLGRAVSVAGIEHTIVGVMPPGFGFPVNQQLWTPLRIDSALEPLQGPPLYVFGRLAQGTTIDMAHAELDRYVARAASEHPEAYEHLQGSVRPYTEAFSFLNALADGDGVEYWNVFTGLLLLLICGNVALLMLARAASRDGEIVVRTALGASRQRIVSQLFFEALVLGTVAGLVGIGAAGVGLERLHAVLTEQMPAFWYSDSLSSGSLVYAGMLTLLAAILTGVVPGLRVTSGAIDRRLRRQTLGGGAPRFGGLWTAVIVLQLAATATFPVAAWIVWRDSVRIEHQDLGFASAQYLTFGLGLNVSIVDDDDVREYQKRLAGVGRDLSERLEAEPSVGGTTIARAVPGTHHVRRRIEMDAGGEAPRNRWDESGAGRRVRGGAVAPNFFDVLGVAPTRGRTFNAADADPEAQTVVVNEPFVDEVLGGRNPIGRRLRYLSAEDYRSTVDEWDDAQVGDEPGPWYQIVGVVPYLGMGNGADPDGLAGLYHAVLPEDLLRQAWLVRFGGEGSAAATRIREIAAEVDPDIALFDLQPLDSVKEAEVRGYAYTTWMILGLSGLATLLSLASIYSVTAFTVTRRTREIGVRVALGAKPARVAAATFRRPLIHVALGLALGTWLCVLLGWGLDVRSLWWKPLVGLLGYICVVTAVCLSACIVPMRRALGVDPTVALSADA
jgi:predicted permease